MDWDKLNVLDIAKSELKSAGYIVAAGQVVNGVRKVVRSAAKKTKNEKVEKFVNSVSGDAAVNFSLAAAAKKLPHVGDSNTVKYITSGLRVGSLANIGNSIIDKITGSNKKKEEEQEETKK
jgi:type II secretory pathway component PulF